MLRNLLGKPCRSPLQRGDLWLRTLLLRNFVLCPVHLENVSSCRLVTRPQACQLRQGHPSARPSGWARVPRAVGWQEHQIKNVPMCVCRRTSGSGPSHLHRLNVVLKQNFHRHSVCPYRHAAIGSLSARSHPAHQAGQFQALICT